MDHADVLNRFMKMAVADPRIGIAHIGLYAVVYNLWQQQGFNGSIKAYASELMLAAKISSTATYHKIIRQLHECGYVCYEPSFYKGAASEIRVRTVESLQFLNRCEDERRRG